MSNVEINHRILYATLQKYYSALNQLDKFGNNNNFFDDVSCLDAFFSEFRNVTFVLQKNLVTEENRAIYTELRSSLLTGETLKWFIDNRNSTIKENPFPLQKELIIDIYTSGGRLRLKHHHLTVNFEDTFDESLNYIKTTLPKQLKLVEIFFSTKINFKEGDQDIDLYPKIKKGLQQMHEFILRIQEIFPCKCKSCEHLSNLINEKYILVLNKELLFVRDYVFEPLKNELTLGQSTAIYFGDNQQHLSIANSKTTLSYFMEFGAKQQKANSKINIFDAFKRFTLIHAALFLNQKHTIMPVFFIVFNDQTVQMIPFIPTVKSTFYRQLNEIVDNNDFTTVLAIFYCGEYYSYHYSKEEAQRLVQIPYSQRKQLASKEVLSCRLFINQGGEWEIDFDESKINNPKYIAKQIKGMHKIDNTKRNSIDCFYQLKNKLNIYK